MKIGIFYNSISNPKKFSNKIMLMDNFRDGVLANNDSVIEYKDSQLPDQQLDAGFVLGYTLENNFRKKIINRLSANNIPTVFVDSNILHYARSEHEWHRYSMNSVYPDTGTYFFDQIDRNKWEQYSAWHGVTAKPWRTAGHHILILCQRSHGWNMLGNDQAIWLGKTIKRLQKMVPERPIVVRLHPRDGDRHQQAKRLKIQYSNTVTVSTNQDIVDDLKNCWCAVGFNSTPNAVAAIEGIPVYVEDPVRSWASGVGFSELSDIVNPPAPDRAEWLHQIANIHWSNREVVSGKLWNAIRTYIGCGQQQI